MNLRQVTAADGDVEGIVVTTTDAITGDVIAKAKMGPNADYFLITGPKFELSRRQVYANGTIQLTIRRAAASDGEGEQDASDPCLCRKAGQSTEDCPWKCPAIQTLEGGS